MNSGQKGLSKTITVLLLTVVASGYAGWHYRDTHSAVLNPEIANGHALTGVANTDPGHGDARYAMSSAGSGRKSLITPPEGIAYYTCSMHGSVRSAVPGKCPICGMDLVAVNNADIQSGTIIVDTLRRQTVGITVAAAERREVWKHLRLAGSIVVAEDRQHVISVRSDGWVISVQADFAGKPVHKGEVLFSYTSPALLAAQEEYLSAGKYSDSLRAATAKRLVLLGMGERQLAELQGRGKAYEGVTVTAPATGVLLEKMIVAGSPIMSNAPLMKLADLSIVWLTAAVAQHDLPPFKMGQTVQVRLFGDKGDTLAGKLSFIAPTVDSNTRTANIRISLNNADGQMRPGAYADVSVGFPLGERLVVPEGAVLYAGDKRVVFVDMGEDRIKPRVVQTGERLGDDVEIVDGLTAGEKVIASGVFLIASESRLKTGASSW